MKLALIPSLSYLDKMYETDYQLMLPHLTHIDTYASSFVEAKARGDFVILDNGEAEGIDITPAKLFEIANEFHVDEVVLPDVIGDAEGTIAKGKEALRQLSSGNIHFGGQVMVVAQGKTINECYMCIDAFRGYDGVATIGIPRHLLSIHGGARYVLTKYIHDVHRGRFQVHYLGTNALNVREVMGSASGYVGPVRGVDTSAPFNYAYACERIDSGAVVRRPQGYFKMGRRLEHLVNHNIEVLKDWVGYEEPFISGRAPTLPFGTE